MRYAVTLDGRTWQVEVLDGGLLVDGRPVEATLEAISGTPLHALRVGYGSHRIVAARDDDGEWRLDVDGRPARLEVVDERTRRLREMAQAAAGPVGPRPVKAPMPGLVVKVEVEEGQVVAPGDGLVIVEAMKMENELRAETAARVVRIRVVPGDAVEKDQILVDLEAVHGEEEG